ncbi:ORF8a [Gammacoronavirus brantae]|uniref:ORF8a n=1 Tax=Canada goose coronavirus TaxID=2569586 RepID=A0A4D6FT76_9GAMC|nr:ORF8a [Canada goose coronavirus]QCB65103.1 ORF8a [Canada goose coronavirus]
MIKLVKGFVVFCAKFYRSLLLCEVRILSLLVNKFGLNCLLANCRDFLSLQLNVVYRLIDSSNNSLV